MGAMERIGRKILEKEFTESVFKVMSYLAICTATVGLTVFSFKSGEFAGGFFLFILAVGLGFQTFFYSYRYVSIPVCQAIWDKVNYERDIQFLLNCPKEQRYRILKTVVFSWPVLIALVFYAVGIYGITSTLELLIQLNFPQVTGK